MNVTFCNCLLRRRTRTVYTTLDIEDNRSMSANDVEKLEFFHHFYGMIEYVLIQELMNDVGLTTESVF